MQEIYKYYGSYYIRSKRHDVYVSNFGNVKDNGKIRQNPTKAIHQRIYIAVAELFLPNPENKPQVDHIDTNRRNNRVDNLRWVTNQENMHNPTTRKHCSLSAKKRWKDGMPEYMIEKMRGRTPWNKGKRGEGQSMFGKKHSEETKTKMSRAHKGKRKVWNNEEHTKYHFEYKDL